MSLILLGIITVFFVLPQEVDLPPFKRTPIPAPILNWYVSSIEIPHLVVVFKLQDSGLIIELFEAPMTVYSVNILEFS